MNIDRVRLQKSWHHKIGQDMAESFDPLPKAVADAIAQVQEEVDELFWELNNERREAKTRSKYGF